MGTGTEQAWPRARFEQELRRLRAYYHDRHPYQAMMNRGELTQSQLQGWVVNRYYYQITVPRKDAALLANCPEPDVRRRWLQRLLDHDGQTESEGGIEAWIQLGLAVGLSREAIVSERHVLPGVRFAVERYLHFVREAHWIGGVASSLTELFAPDLHRQRIVSWPEHYPWIDPQGLDYFRRRIGQADRDIEHGLALVLERCDHAALQRRAMEALALKLEILWSMLDAMYLAYVMEMPPFFNVEEASPWAPGSAEIA